MSTLATAAKHIRRSPYQALAAVTTMFVTFLLAGIVFLSVVASFFTLQYFEGKPQITVFMADKSDKQEAEGLGKTLEQTGKVASVTYVSKEDALAIYREQNKNDPLLLEMVTADILPASLEISAKEPKYLADLVPIIKEASGVEEVVYQKDVVDALIAWTNAIRLIGGVLTGLLAFNSILTIMTVVGMKIALKREEIDVLRLVGASRWYIRLPFVLEGGLYGIGGALLSWAIIMLLVIWLQPVLFGFLGMIPPFSSILLSATSTPFIVSSLGFLGGLLVTGFFLGSVGSLIALGRYLKF
ncbi:MAG: permease-like cell division protein FtsX [Patescibacteria group bacterium]